MILIFAFASGASAGVGVTLALVALIAVLAAGTALILMGTDEGLAARKDTIAVELPAARKAWLAYREAIRKQQAERQAAEATRIERDRELAGQRLLNGHDRDDDRGTRSDAWPAG